LAHARQPPQGNHRDHRQRGKHAGNIRKSGLDDPELFFEVTDDAEVVAARIFLVEDVELLLQQAHAAKAIIALAAGGGEEQVVGVGAVGALGQVGRLAAALAAAAVREQHRIDAFFAVARAKAALARLAEHAVDAAGALLDLHAADVGARYLVGLLQAP